MLFHLQVDKLVWVISPLLQFRWAFYQGQCNCSFPALWTENNMAHMLGQKIRAIAG